MKKQRDDSSEGILFFFCAVVQKQRKYISGIPQDIHLVWSHICLMIVLHLLTYTRSSIIEVFFMTFGIFLLTSLLNRKPNENDNDIFPEDISIYLHTFTEETSPFLSDFIVLYFDTHNILDYFFN